MSDKRERILLIEDNPGDVRLIQEMLTEAASAPYHLDCADQLSTGLECLAKEKVNVVLLDLGLLDSQGVETLRRLQAQAPTVPIVVLTGLDDEAIAVQAVREGAQDYLLKTEVHSKMLWRVIRYAIERKKAEGALRESEKKYRVLVENANESIVVAQDGVLRFANPKAMEITGYSEEELTSMPFVELIHPNDRDMVAERHLRTLKGEQFSSLYPFRVIDREGNIKWVEINAVMIDWEGRPATLDFLNDITERKRAEEQIQKDYEAMVLSLAIALEARDPYTRGHSERVKRYCRVIARQMGLPTKRIQELERAASLHDIGKIAVPDVILGKPGRLTPPEFAQVQLHPEKSVDLIRLIPNPQDTLLAIRHHHERVDGKGYPDGLSNENIPLEARILAVADAYDALTSERPYRKAFNHEEALRILRENAGTQWDAKVVEAAVEALTEKH